MFELTDIIYFLIIFIILHFWWKTMQAREKAETIVKAACQLENMQLLDATVSLKKFSYEKNKRGNRIFLRYFSFEFSDTGEERREGIIAMHSTVRHYLFMDLPEKPTITINSQNDSINNDDNEGN